MQAIITKYIGPTNTKGSRIKATCNAGSLSIPYPHELNGEDAHRAVAETLADKLGWSGDNYGKLVGGGLPNDAGYCFVFVKGG